MRRTLPLVVMIGAGAIVLLGEFRSLAIMQRLCDIYLCVSLWSDLFTNWAGILFAFAMILGLVNLLRVHGRRVRLRVDGWPYSVVLITTVVVVLLAGLGGVSSPSLQWIFHNVQSPLEATLLSLVVFFAVVAVVRAARTRSPGVIVMLMTAAIVLLGQMPLGNTLSPELVNLQQWLSNVPAIAGQRGILLGITLGVIASGLRLIFGVERERFFH